jgi:hypothetical protein
MSALMLRSPVRWSRVQGTSSQAKRLARMRRAAVELTPEAVEQIAQRVAQLLRHQPIDSDPVVAKSSLVSAVELAQQLGVTRAWVYEHARELGAIRLGEGPRPRLRFDPDVAAQTLRRHHVQQAPASPPDKGTYRAHRRPVERAVPLLPLRGHATRGIRSVLTSSRRVCRDRV